MIVESSKSSTQTSGMGKPRAFAFEFNEVMFKTLSEAYSDPVRAVIRELACNSYDAHVMAKNPKPFEIHLPTTHEPEFIIRDFGTGMDDDEINELFTMYGGSNKRNNNEVIGALGIGSKSPYAVTPMYNVISTKNGITRTYVCDVEDGLPKITPDKVLETPDAPNGVTVQFSVPEGKIWEYENKAKIALEFFDTDSVKVNVKNFVAHQQSYVLKSDTWGLRKEARTAVHGYACRAIMGRVQYQIGAIDESRTNSLQKKILEMPIDMHFPLGALDFAPSRETLKLSDKTIKAVLGMCDKIFDESLQTVKEKIDACKDVWEAQILLYSLLNATNNTMSGGSGMSGLIKEALDKGKLYGQYKNFMLAESKAIINMLQYSHINVSKFEHNERRRRYNTENTKRCKKEPFIAIDPKMLREDKKLAKASGDPLVISRNRFEITVKPDVLFVINDTGKPGDKYIHYHIQESKLANGVKTVYMIHRNDKDADIGATVKNALKLVADIGNAPVIRLSKLVTDYATVFAARRTSGSRGKSYQIAVLKSSLPQQQRRTQNGWAKSWRAPIDEEMEQTKKFYVVVEKRIPTELPFGNVWDFDNFMDEVRASGRFGIDRETPIFAVRKNHKVLKSEGWVELMSHIYSRVNEIMTPTKTLALSLYMKPFYDDCEKLLSHLASKQPLTNSPAQCFACSLAEAKDVRMDNWRNFKTILDFCQVRGKYTPGLTLDFNEKWAEIKAQYPMLQFVGRHSVRNNIQTLVDYIRQVDLENQVGMNNQIAVSAVAASN